MVGNNLVGGIMSVQPKQLWGWFRYWLWGSARTSWDGTVAKQRTSDNLPKFCGGKCFSFMRMNLNGCTWQPKGTFSWCVKNKNIGQNKMVTTKEPDSFADSKNGSGSARN